MNYNLSVGADNTMWLLKPSCVEFSSNMGLSGCKSKTLTTELSLLWKIKSEFTYATVRHYKSSYSTSTNGYDNCKNTNQVFCIY